MPPSTSLNGACFANALSDDGRFVAFRTIDALDAVGLALLPDTIATPFGGTLLPVAIPNLVDLCGVHVYVQAFVVDAVAPFGVAFTRGIDAMIGG